MRIKHITVLLLAILSGVSFGVASSTFLLQNGYFTSNYRAFVVQSGSMEPSIKTGAIVLTKSFDTYSVGEIISFNRGKQVVTHRISGTEYGPNGNLYTTKGDANEEADIGRVAHGDILGKAQLSIPYLGYLSQFVRTPKGFVILVIIPATIIVYEELKKLVSELKNRLLKKIYKPSKAVHRASVIIPFAGLLLLLVASTNSFFHDQEEFGQNTLGAAENFEPTPIPTSTPEPAPNLKINEFLPDPSPNPEWVEFYNASASAEYIKNYFLDDDIHFASDSGTSIIKPLTQLNTSNPTYPYLEFSSFLNNSGDFVVLFDELGTILDQYQYLSNPGDNVTIGREVDGSGAFKNCTIPTKGSSNNGSC